MRLGRCLVPVLIVLPSLAGCNSQGPQSQAVSARGAKRDEPAAVEAAVTEISAESGASAPAAPPIKTGADDWPWWRGPSLNGVAAAGQNIPTTWSESENVVWQSPIAGRGHGSPTIVGERVFLATADEAAQVQSVVCLDRATGQPRWKKDLHTGGFPRDGEMHPESSHASCTPACDGERVFVAFLNKAAIHATALDLEGNIVWQTNLGAFSSQFGYGASPAIYKSFVLFAADHKEGGSIAAVHRETGKIRWRKLRAAMPSYSPAIVATVAGVDQLLLSGTNRVVSLDPTTGEERWSCDGPAQATCTTMTFDGDFAFATGGYPEPGTLCIRADGSGEIVWKNESAAYVPSPLVHGGRLYTIDGDGGIGYCWRAESGEQLWKGRFQPKVRSSPVLVDGNVLVAATSGKTYVVNAGVDRHQVAAENQLGDEMYATPAACGGRLYLRVASSAGGERRETLYCIGTR